MGKRRQPKEPDMSRDITFRKVTAGHYVNDETGVEIRTTPAQRIGRHGHRVAGWEISAPSYRSDGLLSRSEVGFETTLKAATGPATIIALKIHAQIARDYAEATRSYLNRISIDIQDNATDTGWDAAQSLLAAANDEHRRGGYDRARNLAARAHAAAFRTTGEAVVTATPLDEDPVRVGT
jgi:hypothetical protein